MIRAVAIDDEPLPLEILINYCTRNSNVELVKTFNKLSAAREYLVDHEVDLLFLDIQMPSMTGIDFYKSLSPNQAVIFTTAHSQYAVEGFNLDAVDYLLKPFDYERFDQAIQKALKYLNKEIPPSIVLKADYGKHIIGLSEIRYVEGMADYVRLHLENKKPLVVRNTMKEMERQLGDGFFRVHRSYIVSLCKIQQVRNKTVCIDQLEIPIGRTYWNDFWEIWSGRVI